jgi:hypothetical protein
MSICDVARIPKDSKSWSLAREPGSNGDKPPGGTTPIALPVPEAPLRTSTRHTGQSR